MRRRSIQRPWSQAALACSAIMLSGCVTPTPALEPHGPSAVVIADLWWLLFWVTGIVTVIVFALFGWAIVRARRGDSEPRGSPPLGTTGFVVVGGALIPAAIVAFLLWYSLEVGKAVSAVAEPEHETLVVIGQQFWWDVHYPDHGVITANELHVPVGVPVRVLLESPDVIHSFWVPNLAGKLDNVPGKTTELWIRADAAGTYRGQCAEFCGAQHALMGLLVIAQPRDAYVEWLTRQRMPAPEPATGVAERGRALFITAGCAECHTIRGVAELPLELGGPGPDLTHLASRRTLAAATLENTRENLALWISDPQRVKPGNRMPPTLLSPSDLAALVSYLETLW